jgi:hypothetical protein
LSSTGAGRPEIGKVDLAHSSILPFTVLPGTNWAQLILAGLIGTACYLPLAFLLALRADHRELLVAKVRKRLSGTVQSAAAMTCKNPESRAGSCPRTGMRQVTQ